MPLTIADIEDVVALGRLEDTATIPDCPYCYDKTRLVSGKTIYPHRSDLFEKLFWLCENDEAFVGCHPGTTRALGTPANGTLRKLRSLVHLKFDPKWKKQPIPKQARIKAYEWLAKRMGLTEETCHVGMFNEAQCRMAIEICEENDVEKLINM